MPSGNRPLVRARHAGHSLISASTRRSTTSKTMSYRTRRSRSVASTPEKSAPQVPQASTVAVSSTVVLRMLPPVCRFGCAPLPFASPPARRAVPSPSVCDGGREELALVFGVALSRNSATRMSSSRNRALISARVSAPASPLRLMSSNRARQSSSRSRSEAAFTVAITPPPPPSPPP